MSTANISTENLKLQAENQQLKERIQADDKYIARYMPQSIDNVNIWILNHSLQEIVNSLIENNPS